MAISRGVATFKDVRFHIRKSLMILNEIILFDSFAHPYKVVTPRNRQSAPVSVVPQMSVEVCG